MEFVGPSSGWMAPISSWFCSPHPSQITISVKHSLFGGRKYTVYGSQGQLLLSAEEKSTMFRQQIVFRDAPGRILAVMQGKLSGWQYRWDVYRDTEANESSFMFMMRMASRNIFSPSFDLEVYLLNNQSRNPDFKAVRKGMLTSNYSILQGMSTIAEARRRGSDYILTVNPGVDVAFLSVFIVFLDIGNDAARRQSINTGTAIHPTRRHNLHL